MYSLQEMYQGFFLAPHVVSQSLKGALFTSLLLEKMKMKTVPKYNVKRTDLIQTVQFDAKEQMIAFCQSIQHASPINAHFSQNQAICLVMKMMSLWQPVLLFRVFN